jgi:hypothetical protein
MKYTAKAIPIALFPASPAHAQTSFDGDGAYYDWTDERSAHPTTWWKESGRAGEQRAFVYGLMHGLTTSSRVYPADMLEHPELMGEGVYAWSTSIAGQIPSPV